MIEIEEIIMLLIGLAVSGLGWWLKTLSREVKENTRLNLEQKGEIQSLERLNEGKFDSLREITETQISALTQNINQLTKTVERHIEVTEKRIYKIEQK